jgi:putative acetyltransferase
METTDPVIIVKESLHSNDARSLMNLLDHDLYDRYPQSSVHGLAPSDIADSGVVFLVARVRGQAVGCGAVRRLEAEAGEVKRMFVLPEFRGRGIAKRILRELESIALELGFKILRLETGSRQPEAINLYASMGYREIPPYGEYAGDPFSVCFEKRLG